MVKDVARDEERKNLFSVSFKIPYEFHASRGAGVSTRHYGSASVGVLFNYEDIFGYRFTQTTIVSSIVLCKPLREDPYMENPYIEISFTENDIVVVIPIENVFAYAEDRIL